MPALRHGTAWPFEELRVARSHSTSSSTNLVERGQTRDLRSWVRQNQERAIVTPEAILGRAEELASAKRFLDHDSNGPRALLLEGEVGIGKTTMWVETVRIASGGGQVLVSRASETEVKLSFTVLTDLLAPAMGDIGEAMPAPQRRALEAALLLEEPIGGAFPDARAVSLGALGALRTLAKQAPITLAIDDLQWTDLPSARALSFALRRLVDEPVTIIAAWRTVAGEPAALQLSRDVPNLHRLALGPLPTASLGQLLRRLGRPFPHPLVRRIHEASGGNPFFALEIGRAFKREGVRPSPGEPLPVPDDLHLLLRARLATVSGAVRDALLTVALAAAPTVDLVEAMGGSRQALEEAAHTDIVVIQESTVSFTHPLLAAAVYRGAAPSLRRDVHRRLAELVTGAEDRARHLALSSARPNAEIVLVLDRAALGARARGSPQAGAELSELALLATPQEDLRLRQRRAKVQAENLFDAGNPPHAREILEGMIAELEAGPSRADALYLLSEFNWKDLVRVSDLLRQALGEAGHQLRLRSRILSDLAWVELDTGNLVEAARRGCSAVNLAESADDSHTLRLSLSVLAMAEFLMGRPAGDLLERARALQGALAPADLSSPATCLGRQLMWMGDLDGARYMLESELARYRDQGHETACYEILAHLAEVDYRTGQLDRAMHHLDEADDIAAEAGIDVLGEILPVRAAVKCATADVNVARNAAMEGLAVCDRTGDRWNEIRCRSALGLLELTLNDPAAAYAWLERLPRYTEAMGLTEPGVFPFVPDLVEALASLGEIERAQALTENLDERGVALDRPLAIGTAARCYGLIAATGGDLSTAATRLEQSTSELTRVNQPFELARSLLVAGGIQRRMKKKRSSRELLTRAVTIFEDLGASLWVEKGRTELSRIGGRAPSPSELTPTEEQIARLVAQGRTNREAASALFVSVPTIEANLKRVYRKLGIRSRTELANIMSRQSHS